MTAYASQQDVLAALERTGTSIPAAYYLGTADHESDFDLDNVSDNGTSVGLYQVNTSEQSEAGVPGSLRDIDVNTRVFVYLAERNRNAIRDAVGLSYGDPDPWDMGAYLAIAHNQGLGAALKTLASYPPVDPGVYLGWTEYKARNNCGLCSCVGAGICRYGDDVLYSPQTGLPLSVRASGGVTFMSAAAVLFLAFAGVRYFERRSTS